MKILENILVGAVLIAALTGVYAYTNNLDLTNPAVRTCLANFNWFSADQRCQLANTEIFDSDNGASLYQSLIDSKKNQPMQFQIQEPNFRPCRDGAYC